MNPKFWSIIFCLQLLVSCSHFLPELDKKNDNSIKRSNDAQTSSSDIKKPKNRHRVKISAKPSYRTKTKKTKTPQKEEESLFRCPDLEFPECEDITTRYPAKCSLSKFYGSRLPEQTDLVTWGKSICEAKTILVKEACKIGYKISKADEIACQLDTTGDSCPSTPVICEKSRAPTVCTARSYKQKQLHFSQFPKAWGSNECWARSRLKQLACQLNLKPDELADISCERDFTMGECPVNEASVCSAGEKKPKTFFVCEAKKFGPTELDTPLVTYGESKCEAKIALFHMACQYTDAYNKLRPSLLTQINCYSEL